MSPRILHRTLHLAAALILVVPVLRCSGEEQQPRSQQPRPLTADSLRPGPRPAPGLPPAARAAALIRAAAPTVDCDKRPLPGKLAALQALAARQQPCAMAALGGRYLDGQGGNTVEGLRLVRAAWGQGAAVSSLACMAFKKGIGGRPDPALALRCFVRARDWTRAAVAAYSGAAADRDLAPALIAKDGGGWSCGDAVKAAVARGKHQTHCELCPDNNVHGFLCGALDRLERAHRAEQRLAPLVARLDGPARAALTKLRQAAARYAEDESTKVYHEYIDGSARGTFAELRKEVIGAHLADDLGRLLGGELPAVSGARLARLDRALALALRQHRSEEGAEAFRKQLRRAQRSWLAYRAAWDRFAAGAAPAARGAIRARLTVQRIYLLVWSPSTHDKTNLEQLVGDLVKAGVYTNASAAELDGPLRAADAFELALGSGS